MPVIESIAVVASCAFVGTALFGAMFLLSLPEGETGGCFTGDGLVKLKNGQLKRVDRLTKNDQLENGATINCIVRTQISARIPMVNFPTRYGQLTITGWHPVRLDGKWWFPAKLRQPKIQWVEALYTLVLDSEHYVTVNGIDCITLGASLRQVDEVDQLDLKILQHPYFGTQKVIDDLKLFHGYNDGLVDLKPANIIRDEKGKFLRIKPIRTCRPTCQLC